MLDAINTVEVPPKRRLDYWRTWLQRNGVEVDTSCQTNNFVAVIRRRALGSLNVYEVATDTPHAVARRSSDNGLFFANMQFDPHDSILGGGYEHPLDRCSSLNLYDTKQAYSRDFDGATRSTVIVCPRRLLENRVENLDWYMGRALSYNLDLVTLLARQCRSISAIDCVSGSLLELDLSQNLLDLLVLILRNSEQPGEIGPRPFHSTMLRRAKAYVQSNIRDPDLDPSLVAKELGISVRTLHGIFRSEGTTFMRWNRFVSNSSCARVTPTCMLSSTSNRTPAE